ncbi:MAG: CheY-like chemotaxis protein [Candidatus Endobugula sp.]|jgi:CheY-like chemotaxis protein
MKILIVDDSRAMQTIVRRGIEQLGYRFLQFKQARNGLEALDIIRVWEPSFIISDWHMPEMSGVELLHAVNREMLGIHIGFVTTESSEERLAEAQQAGAAFIIQKPFDTKTLHEALLPIIQGHTEEEEYAGIQHQGTQEEIDRITSEHIVLPSIQQLSEKLNSLALHNIQLQSTSHMSLSSSKYPYLLGLYGDKEKQSVHAITIADHNAICILGTLHNKIMDGAAQVSVADKVLGKRIMANSKKTLHHIETLLYNKKKEQTLLLRSTNVMRKENPNIQKLLSKSDHRLDVTIAMKGSGAGNLTFIVS